MYLAFLLTLLSFITLIFGKILYAGVNESGGEFGVYAPNQTGFGLPGKFGVDYAFINKSTVDIFVDQEKINFFRVTFLMERMCPPSTGLGSTFSETYFAEYQDAINYITETKGAYALIDPHNYMRYGDPSQQPFSGSIIGDTTDPNAATAKAFEIFWFELAHRFRHNPKVIFGINNEPHNMATSLVLTNNQAAIKGIRLANATQLILAPGNGFTGGNDWTEDTGDGKDLPSSSFLNHLVDPLQNTAIDVHQYLDIDYSGSDATCAQSGPSSLASLTSWLQQNNLKAIVSEFGGGNNQNCYQYITDLLNYLAANDVYIGWSMWAAGPLWFSNSACCGASTGSLEPGYTNSLGEPNAFDTVWAHAVRPLIPQDLKRSGASSLS